MKKLLAFDLGTGGNKASLFAADGTFIASTFVDYPTVYPGPGLHEQSPLDWYRAVVQSTRDLLAKKGISADDIVAIALSGHSLGCVPLDSDGNLLRNHTPIWSDRRPEKEAERFFEKIDSVDWYLRTGNGFPAPHYMIFKLLWYREHEPEMFRQIDRVVGTKDYINFRLTGRIATDPSYASGSGVYSLSGWDYDDSLLEAAGIDRRLLPDILPSTEPVGTLTPQAAEELGLSLRTVVVAGGVDNSCMALGAGAFKAGRLYSSLGSSSWIALSDRQPLLDEKTRPYVFAHVVPEMYASALAIFSSGTTFQWLREQLCGDLEIKAADTGLTAFDLMVTEAATSPIGANGLIMNPSLGGGSSLDPTPQLRGGLVNLDLSHTRADIIRACMEGISINMRIVLDRIRQLAETESKMIAVGGGNTSSFWRQVYADAMKISIIKTNIGRNTAALGAAALAAVGIGEWNSFDRIDSLLQVEETTHPISENVQKYEVILSRFQKATGLLAEYAMK